MPITTGRTEKAHGFVNKQFLSVQKVFEKNFFDGFERDGANFAVFHKNKAVVNLWGGNADTKAGKAWTKQTRSILFSVTKPLSGLCIAILADRGYLNYEDPVSKYWPEFGQNGKENTTIKQILDHEAGLPYIEEEISLEDAQGNSSNVLRKLEKSKPLWVPGTATGYHPVTYGWLIDGIIRNADPKSRTLKQFFKEEIAQPYGLDIDIGSDPAESYRNTYFTLPSIKEYIRDIIIDPRIIPMLFLIKLQHPEAIINKVGKNPKFLDIDLDDFPFNDPAIQELSIGSATGVSNAYNLARLFSFVTEGKILSPKMLSKVSRPSLETWHIEKTVIYPVMKGHGFFYEYHPTHSGHYTFGHPGFGCQGLYIDKENELVITYLSNSIKTATSYLCLPYQRLIEETYRSIRQ
uniref:Beta-lactamase-related domain-containing protein n=1 Tax=Panagrolaimus superbus TaxID=310955 RepID=A0A914Z0K1_9BILA